MRSTRKTKKSILTAIREEQWGEEVPDVPVAEERVHGVKLRGFLRQQIPPTLECILQAAKMKDKVNIAKELKDRHPMELQFPPKDWLNLEDDLKSYLGALFITLEGDVDPIS